MINRFLNRMNDIKDEYKWVNDWTPGCFCKVKDKNGNYERCYDYFEITRISDFKSFYQMKHATGSGGAWYTIFTTDGGKSHKNETDHNTIRLKYYNVSKEKKVDNLKI